MNHIINEELDAEATTEREAADAAADAWAAQEEAWDENLSNQQH